jgi:hypothetical protein
VFFSVASSFHRFLSCSFFFLFPTFYIFPSIVFSSLYLPISIHLIHFLFLCCYPCPLWTRIAQSV